MKDVVLNRNLTVARNLIAGYLLTLGIVSSVSEDSIEQEDTFGFHVYTYEERIMPKKAKTIDVEKEFTRFLNYLNQYNEALPEVHFLPNEVCFHNLCGLELYFHISIYYCENP